MNTNCISKHRFNLHQTVSFIGGLGKIKNIQLQDGRWTYTIEMSMGAKPDFSRVGAETTIVLEEQDIHQAESDQI